MCYLRAFIAPLAWKLVTRESKDNLEPDDYDTLLQSAQPLLQYVPSGEVELPKTVARQKLEKMCVVLFLFK